MCQCLHSNLGSALEGGLRVPSEDVPHNLPARRPVACDQLASQSTLCVRGAVWDRLYLICIFHVNFGFVSLAAARICWVHTAPLEGHRHLDTRGRRESHRYSLDLPYFRVYVSGHGDAGRGFRLLLRVPQPLHRLYRGRNYIGSKLSLSSGSDLLPYGWAQKVSWLSREVA